MRTFQETEAAIFNLGGSLLLGKTTEEEIKLVIADAKAHNLLPRLLQVFNDVTRQVLKRN